MPTLVWFLFMGNANIGYIGRVRLIGIGYMGHIGLILIFIFGSAIGSFLNVVICRLETGEGIVKKRSHCVKCGKTLTWYELIPIISFLGLGGRCRSCKEKISWQYPLVEIATGFLFLAVFYFLGFRILDLIGHWKLVIGHWFLLIYLWYLISSLIVIFVYDLRHYIIPDVVLFPAIGVSFLYRLFEVLNFGHCPLRLCLSEARNLFEIWDLGFGIWQNFFSYLIAATVATVFFLTIILVTRGRGMGLGDAKLAFLMGLLLGWPNILVALFLAFFVGAVIGVGLIFWGSKTMKSQIPFGPFLIGGTIIMLFWGQLFLDWCAFLYF